ncbi:MAG TPA: hypothetical protein VGK73_23880 [Polyangiaceae bacterium]
MGSTRVLFALALALLTLLLCGRQAGARVEGDSGYSKAQTYSGALRFLRVDLGYEVLEKDPEAAYLVFRYTAPGQGKNEATGTVEVVETGERVRVFVRIPRMPEYHERILRDGLLKKLREEYGTPAPRKPEAKPEPTDAGTDGG